MRLEGRRQRILKRLVDFFSRRADAELLHGRAMEQLSLARVFDDAPLYFAADRRTGFGECVELVREQCRRAGEAARRSHGKICGGVVGPLKELLQEQARARREIEEKYKSANEEFKKQMDEFEENKIKYYNAFKEFDGSMTVYVKAFTAYSESKRIKEALQIKEKLKRCKETERNYKEVLNALRIAKVEKSSKYV